MGESTTRSQSPYDPAIHTMEEVDVTASRCDNAVGGVGAWAPPDNGEGMDLDSVTDMAGAGDCARSDVGRLGLGQVSVREAGGPDEAMDCVSTLEDPAADASSRHILEQIRVIITLSLRVIRVCHPLQPRHGLAPASRRPA